MSYEKRSGGIILRLPRRSNIGAGRMVEVTDLSRLLSAVELSIDRLFIMPTLSFCTLPQSPAVSLTLHRESNVLEAPFASPVVALPGGSMDRLDTIGLWQ